MTHLEQVLSLIEKRTGMDVITLGGTSVVEKAMEQSRMADGYETISEWLVSLQGSQELWKAFLHKIVVGETFFFRYPESYEALAAWVVRHPARPLRILSVPCSTGEEAYSIAITLARAGLMPHEYSILGTDVNERSVMQAKAGIYQRSSSFRTNNPSAYEGYVSVVKSAVHVSERIKDQITFETKNFWDMIGCEDGFDIIFCRNLLIYFSAERQAMALDKLGTWLRADGLLFLGPAEVPVASQRGWASAEYPMAFACRKQTAKRESELFPLSLKSLPVLPKPVQRPVHLTHQVQKPLLTLPKPVAVSSHREEPLLDIKRLADRGKIAEAQASLDELMHTVPSNADCFTLAGVLAEAVGNTIQAEKMFRKALYLSPAHAEAVSHLAWLLQADGRLEASRKLLARADRLHQS